MKGELTMKTYLTGEALYTKLCEMGAARWTKGEHDRIYFNRAGRDLLGLTLEYYNTGNIRYAELNGESISNSRARKLCAWLETVYYDCKTGKLCWRAGTCPNSDYADVLMEAINTIPAPESDDEPASETEAETDAPETDAVEGISETNAATPEFDPNGATIALAEYARRLGKKPVVAVQRAERGSFKTAFKSGGTWLINETEAWIDRRVKSGKYIGVSRPDRRKK